MEQATQPCSDRAEIVGEAFVFAAINNRRDVVDHLLDVGAVVDARPHRNTTALHSAIQFNRAGMARHLLDRGASVAIEDGNCGEAAVAIRELLGTNRS